MVRMLRMAAGVLVIGGLVNAGSAARAQWPAVGGPGYGFGAGGGGGGYGAGCVPGGGYGGAGYGGACGRGLRRCLCGRGLWRGGLRGGASGIQPEPAVLAGAAAGLGEGRMYYETASRRIGRSPRPSARGSSPGERPRRPDALAARPGQAAGLPRG